MCSTMRKSGAAIQAHIRAWMAREGVAALIIPSADAHNSEYVAPQFQRRAVVSNFYGSAGTVVITPQQALLWTDGRYWLDAADSLYTEFELMKQGQPSTPSVEDWLNHHLPSGSAVGLDPYLCTVAEWSRLSQHLTLRAVSSEAIDPYLPPAPDPPALLQSQPIRYSGASTGARRAALVQAMQQAPHRADVMLLSALDEVAWLTNMRGKDVPYNPVFYAYALVDAKDSRVRVYVDARKVSDSLRQSCRSHSEDTHISDNSNKNSKDNHTSNTNDTSMDNIENKNNTETSVNDEDDDHGKEEDACAVEWVDYADMERDVAERAAHRVALVDELQTSQAVYDMLQRVCARVVRVSCGPAQQHKAVKNAVERAGFRACHIRDGVILTRYLAWLYNAVTQAAATQSAATAATEIATTQNEEGLFLREDEVAGRLDALRRADELFVELSFPTISAFGANGALCHYRAYAHTAARLHARSLYLVDSGAHYRDGTTDVTRTICFDATSVTAQQREAYTRVLQGHIRLHQTIFPSSGVSGHRLDALARTALWEAGLDYAHGTGHGVGHGLAVHEGPHGIGVRPTPTGATLSAGMIVSNEPGYYEAGEFGIRIENLEEVVEVRTSSGAVFWGFRALTMVPLCRELMDVALLSEQERKWVNEYHAEVLEKVMPGLVEVGDAQAMAYLRHHTRPI